MISPRILFDGDPTEAYKYVGIAKEFGRSTFGAGVISKVWQLGAGVQIRVMNNIQSRICKVWIKAGYPVTGFQFYLKNPENIKGFSYPDFSAQSFSYGYDLSSTDDFYIYRLVPTDVETYKLFLDRSQKKRTSQSVPINQRNRTAINFAGPSSGLPLYYVYQRLLSPPALVFRYYEPIYVQKIYAFSPSNAGGFFSLGHSTYNAAQIDIPLTYQENTIDLQLEPAIILEHINSSEDVDSIALGGFRGRYVVGTDENSNDIKKTLSVFVIPVLDEDDGYYVTHYLKVYKGGVKKNILVAECSLFRYGCTGLFSWDFSSDGSKVTGLASSDSPYPSRIHEIEATISIQLEDDVYSISAEITKDVEHTFPLDTMVETTGYAYDDVEGVHYYTDRHSTTDKNYVIPVCSFYNKNDIQQLVTVTYTVSFERYENINLDEKHSSINSTETIASQLHFPSGLIYNLASYTISVDWYSVFDHEYHFTNPISGEPDVAAIYTGHHIISGSGYIGQMLVLNPKEEHLIYAKRQFDFSKTVGLSEGIDLDYNGTVYLYNNHTTLLEKDISFSLFQEIDNFLTGPFYPIPLFPEHNESATDYELLLFMVSNPYTDANILSASVGYSHLYVKSKTDPDTEDYVYVFNLHGHIAPPLEVIDYEAGVYKVREIVDAYSATGGFDNLNITDSTYGDFSAELKDLEGNLVADATLYPIALRTDR